MKSINNFAWEQAEDDNDPALEVRVEVELPSGGRPKDLNVYIKSGDRVCVEFRGEVMLQSRLHDTVQDEIEWRVEQGTTLIVEMNKATPDTWPTLLRLPVPPTDSAFYSTEELDAMISSELRVLPEPKGRLLTEGRTDEDDLDDLLDETLQEVGVDELSLKEMKQMDEEQKVLLEKQNDFKEQLEKATNAEPSEEGEEASEQTPAADVDDLRKKIASIQTMMELNDQIRRARSKPATLKNFLEIHRLDIRKNLANLGVVHEEAEPFEAGEEQKSPLEIFQEAMQTLQMGDIKRAVHLLRANILHHRHPQSVMVLYRVYSELQQPTRAAYFLVNHALHDDKDPNSNRLVGELFDRGNQCFPPLLGAAIYFNQRAAESGLAASMLSLSNLSMQGRCGGSRPDEDVIEQNKNTERAKTWLNHAIERGSGAAYFVLGNMHLAGDMGMEKSYKLAKKWLDRALKAMPEFRKKMPMIDAELRQLKEAEGGTGSEAGTPVTGGPPRMTSSNAASKPAADKSSRLSALDKSSGNAGAFMEKHQTAKAQANSRGGDVRRAFWERSAKYAAVGYCCYTVAFPIRVMLAPYFFSFMAVVIDTLFGSFMSSQHQGMLR